MAPFDAREDGSPWRPRATGGGEGDEAPQHDPPLAPGEAPWEVPGVREPAPAPGDAPTVRSEAEAGGEEAQRPAATRQEPPLPAPDEVVAPGRPPPAASKAPDEVVAPGRPPPAASKAPDDGVLTFPPAPVTQGQRLRLAGLVALLGAIAVFPCLGCGMVGVATQRLGLDPWLQFAVVFGLTFGVPAIAGVTLTLVTLNVHRRKRGCRINRDAVLFTSSPISTASRIPWDRIESFSLTGDGVMLHLKGLRLRHTRWLGPTIFCEDEDVHRVVVLLEEAGIPPRHG